MRCDAEGQGESHWRLARPLKEAVQDRDGLPPILRVCPCRWLDMCSYSLHWAPSSGYMHSSSTSGSSESVLDVSGNKNFVKLFRHLSRECPTQLLARCRMVDSALQKSSRQPRLRESASFEEHLLGLASSRNFSDFHVYPWLSEG